ncbi:hypothetical protein ACTFIY_000342 [Dictyostelium cf. discoideum]
MKAYGGIIFLFTLFIFFNGVNCQLVRDSIPNQLGIESFSQQQSYLFYQDTSNSTKCYYTLRFIVKDNDSGTLNLANLFLTDIPNILYSTETSTSTVSVVEYSGTIPIGTHTSKLTAMSSYPPTRIIQSDYTLTLTCSMVDPSTLTITIDDVINFDATMGYFSSIRIYGMDYHIFNSLDSLSSDIFFPFSRTNIFGRVWDPLIFENQRNSIFTISIVVSGVIINLTTKSFYLNVPYPTTQFYDVFPQNILSTTFNEFGFHYSPLLSITCDTQIAKPYQLLLLPSKRVFLTKPVSGKKGKMSFITAFQNSYGFNNFSLISPLGDNQSRISLPVNIIGSYGNPQIMLSLIGFGSNNIPSLIPLFQATFTGSNYGFYDNQYMVGVDKFDVGWPFGYISGNQTTYIHSVEFLRPLNYSALSIIYGFGSNILIGTLPHELYYLSVVTNLVTEKTPPILVSYSFKRLKGKNSNYLFTANIISKNGVKKIILDDIDYGLKTLVSGSNKNGVYEIIYIPSPNSFSGIVSFLCYDIYENNFNYFQNQIVSYEPFLVFKTPDCFSNYFSVDSFDNITFAKNNLNLLNSAGYNTMYLNSSKIDPDSQLLLILMDPISKSYQSAQGNVLYGSFPIVYDTNLKLFTCDFIVPKNNLFGEVPYYIKFGNGVFTSYQLGPNTPKLLVNETYLDNQGPIFSFLAPINAGVLVEDDNSMEYGYIFNITDDFNGFSSGSITVKGSMDSSKYVFNFSLSDAMYGNKFESQYQILIPVSKQCISQVYIITNVILRDTNNITSIYNIYSNNADPTITPFLKYYDSGIMSTYLNIVCNPPIPIDKDYQKLVSFKHSIANSIIDVGKFNNSIRFDFSIDTPRTGIKDNQFPIVYIISEKLDKVECLSTLELVDKTYGTTNYTCTTTLPIGFGYPGSLIFSIYGFINNAGYFFGYPTSTIAKYFPSSYYVNINYLIDEEPIITSTDNIFSTGGNLLIYGRSLSNTKQVSIYYSETNVQSTIIQDEIYGSSAVLINSISETSKPFKIQITTTSGLKSNEYWVTPNYFESTTTPVIPTNPPQKCSGNPECGGKSQGYCSPNGCICYSPWIGTSCQSKVIVVPPPIVNPNEPSTNIITNTSKSEASSLVGVISIVSLRELDHNNKVIKTFKFEKWNQTNLEKNRNIYSTSIKFQGNNSNNDCFINVETEWYETLRNITFADQLLVMNPSTLKYNINITAYPFQSKLNTLQLVIRAKLTQSDYNDDICSNQEFGKTVVDNSDFIQLSVKDHSLYGRFVKRGIVDGRITSIDNVKLNDLDDESNYYTSDSFIGILIPQYTNLIQLDPDFGLLVDSSPTDSTCKKSTSLSREAKIGIIVGCVGFVIVVVIVVALYVKYKYHIRNLKPVIKMNQIKVNKN